MYDIIGDIHGHALELKKLLEKLDYKPIKGVWRHPGRKVIFVGDYIDRGPAIRETLHIVKSMVDTDNAVALMGNHEFNALGYHTTSAKGDYLRTHSAVHHKQHVETLNQFENYPAEWEYYLDWFYELPLFFETDGLRAVHACWDEEDIQWLKQNGFTTLSKDFLVDAHTRKSKTFRIIEDILKGKEMDVATEWLDKDGHPRTSSRIKWWKDPATHITHGEFLFQCPQELQDELVDKTFNLVVYPADAPPVFIGHYWLNDELPVVQSGNVACLDYSVAKEGKLVAYRWDGERELDNRKFVTINVIPESYT